MSHFGDQSDTDLSNSSSRPSPTDFNRLRAEASGIHYIHNVSLLEQKNLQSTALELADEITALANSGKYREAAVRFSRAVPITPSVDLPNEHWPPIVHYNLGMLYALAADNQRARRHVELSRLPLGGHHNNFLYAERIMIAYGNLEVQERAIAKGTPSVIITALPKSASTFVSQTLARLLSASVVTLSFESAARPVSAIVIERWARQVARGGAVTHEHYSARFENLECLVRAGIQKMFVQVRDPRAALWSAFRQSEQQSDVFGDTELMRLSERRYELMVDWLKSWLDASVDPRGPKIVFVQYEDVRTDFGKTILRILGEVGSTITEQDVRTHLDAASAAGRKPENFRSGDPDEWRRFMPAELKAWLWQKTVPEVREFLRMLP